MSNNPISTQVKVGRCRRCDAYVFACHSAGLRTAADPTPLDIQAVRSAIIAGRFVYRVIYQAGRPWKLEPLAPGGPKPDPATQTLVASHACGASPLDSPAVEVVDQDPPPAPATPGRPTDGPRRPPARGRSPQGPMPPPAAPPAPRRRFEPVCDFCGHRITAGQPHYAAEQGSRVHFAFHTGECP